MADVTTLYCTVGLPGAGKSSHIPTILRQCPKALVLSSDDIRDSLAASVPYRQSAEGWVWTAIEALARGRLAYGNSVIIDATNVTRARRAAYIYWAHYTGARVECHYLPVEKEESMRRSAKWIPAADIEKLAAQLEPPDETEGWTKLVIVPQEEGKKRRRR